MFKNREKGIIHWIVLIIAGLALLKYFLGWDIFEAASSEEGRSTIGYVKQVVDTVWSYIAGPVTFVWNFIIWPILSFVWQSFLDFVEWSNEARLSK